MYAGKTSQNSEGRPGKVLRAVVKNTVTGELQTLHTGQATSGTAPYAFHFSVCQLTFSFWFLWSMSLLLPSYLATSCRVLTVNGAETETPKYLGYISFLAS